MSESSNAAATKQPAINPKKTRSLAAVLALGFLLLVSLLITAALAATGKYAGTYIPESILHLINLLVSFFVIAAAFRDDVQVAP
jgi:hypothetical protein